MDVWSKPLQRYFLNCSCTGSLNWIRSKRVRFRNTSRPGSTRSNPSRSPEADSPTGRVPIVRVSEWGTSYAGHFMLEAEALGYALAHSDFSATGSNTRPGWPTAGTGKRNTSATVRSNEINQAYRLYTLALAKKPALGAMNRMREMKELSPTCKMDPGRAYLLIGKKRGGRRAGGRTELHPLSSYRELSYTYGSSLRDQAMILEVIHPDGRHGDRPGSWWMRLLKKWLHRSGTVPRPLPMFCWPLENS